MLTGCLGAGRVAAGVRVPGRRPLGLGSLPDCGGLWRPVAADWDALRNLCRLGGPQIIRSSDAGIIGWSDLAGDHRMVRSGRGWLVRMMKDERLKRMIGRNSHTLELGELGGLADGVVADVAMQLSQP